jgi:dephospho-CoA kinase
MIIGLTGSIAAGKGIFSLSNELREALGERNIEITRENLQNFGNEMREKYGVDKIKKKQYARVIIGGIGNPGEVDELKKLKGFFLISIDAS